MDVEAGDTDANEVPSFGETAADDDLADALAKELCKPQEEAEEEAASCFQVNLEDELVTPGPGATPEPSDLGPGSEAPDNYEPSVAMDGQPCEKRPKYTVVDAAKEAMGSHWTPLVGCRQVLQQMHFDCWPRMSLSTLGRKDDLERSSTPSPCRAILNFVFSLEQQAWFSCKPR